MPQNQTFRWADFSRKNRLCAGIAVSLGVLWLASCSAPPEEETANGVSNSVGNSALESTPTPKSAAALGPAYILFLPNADAMLSRRVVRDTSNVLLTTYEQKSRRVLELLFKKLDFLPKGTQLLEAPKKGPNGVVRLNLSKPFLQLDTSPDTAVLLILDSISRTLGALGSKGNQAAKPAKILILVEGKSVREFNQFSLAEPWEPSESDEAMDDIPAENQDSDNKVSDSKTTGNKITDNAVSDDKSADDKSADNKAGGGY